MNHSEYVVESAVEHGALIYFVMRDNVPVSHHENIQLAWKAAEAKAKAEARREGKAAVYTIASTEEVNKPGPRACWKVG